MFPATIILAAFLPGALAATGKGPISSAAHGIAPAAPALARAEPALGPQMDSLTSRQHGPIEPQASEQQLARANRSSSLSQAQLPAPLNPTDVNAFLSGIVALQLVRGDMGGAAVIAMEGDQVLMKKGFGYADVARKTPVDPDTTLFRCGSLTKLVTNVAAMQLVEQGKLSLDTDVNQYLDFKIESTFPQPITLRHLMTHTAGFEYQQQYILQHESDPRIPLRDYLVRFQPRRIYPPGVMGAYSDYGVGLVGYIVQRVSGEEYTAYVQRHIFDPLDMRHATLAQPVPPELRDSLSHGYFSTADPPNDFEVFNPVPAGAMSASLGDIARFSQALMNGGAWSGHRILRPETVQLMWTRQFAVSPELPAMCLGFYEVKRNGVRFVGHGGDTRVFHTLIEIQPERKLLFLSSYNSLGADRSGQDIARSEVFGGFVDRYFPYSQSATWQPVDARAREIAGTYITARRIESGRMKLDSLQNQTRIHINAQGELINSHATDARNHPIRLRYLGNDLWQDEDGQGRLMALRDQTGRVVGLASMFGGMMMVRAYWWEDARFLYPLLAFTITVCCVVILGGFWRLLKRLFSIRFKLASADPVPLNRWQILAALFWIPGVPMLLLWFQHVARQPVPDFDRVPWYFLLQNVLVALAILTSIAAVFFAIPVISQKQTVLSSRIKYAAVALSYLFLIWFSMHWHLIGPINRY